MKRGSREPPAGKPGGKPVTYILRLYVSGATPRSARAIANMKAICTAHLAGRYELEVVDIYQRPELARREQVIAVPTLIKKLPTPIRHLVGDLSREERVLVGLDLKPVTAGSRRGARPRRA